eukprot:TRINITY_DN13380_c0_g1_i1.p3 TRINITY_DN13380_c0_g1~~TRINITY_DN13380_c0_g1_i1.p3  ORF type:complete len:143 (-),score=22.58 TRINITY_DN13380_c0_g1_i1:108-536(-)
MGPWISGFSQLAVVDDEFHIFSRLWCIAEFVQAYMHEIPQNLCVRSNTTLRVDTCNLSMYRRLATLSVSDAVATRPEDKYEILGRIPDMDVFETKLQEALFSNRGVFGSQCVACDALFVAVCIAYRCRRSLAVLSSSEATEV